MIWILHSVLLALTMVSAYNFDYSYNERTHVQTRRVDYGTGQRSERMNERSISVSSGIQRVQEKERSRVVEPYVEEPASRENGTSKIVNTPHISTAMRRGASPDSVVFPGKTSAGSIELIIPPECEKLGICENIPNYPEELVKSIIAKLPKDKLDLLRVDRVEPEIAQRISPGDNEEVELCGHREENFLRPEAQKDIYNKWQIILNDKDKPLQGYRVEVCLEEGTSCAENIAYFYPGYTSVCKQKWTQRVMATIDLNTKQPVFNVPFKVPTCCSCVAIHKNGK